jgi:hypothetical protein
MMFLRLEKKPLIKGRGDFSVFRNQQLRTAEHYTGIQRVSRCRIPARMTASRRAFPLRPEDRKGWKQGNSVLRG